MNNNVIEQAVAVLERGGTLLYPTDTIWGIGCDATNALAVEKIYSIKQRDPNKSMLILCSDIEQLKHYVSSVPLAALDLLADDTRPTTIIYPQARNLPRCLVANDGSIGIRIPKMDFCQAVLTRLGRPIVSTSANFSGCPSPLCYADIDTRLMQMVDYAVPNLWNSEGAASGSRIIKVEQSGQIVIIRN